VPCLARRAGDVRIGDGVAPPPELGPQLGRIVLPGQQVGRAGRPIEVEATVVELAERDRREPVERVGATRGIRQLVALRG